MMSNSQPEKQTEGIRLQKVLAAAGLGSRRACEELIAAGRVSVDGKVVRGQGMRVDPQTAVVSVDGARVNVREDLVYLALNKPRGVLSTMSDPEGRPTVGDYVAERSQRLFHVGRLDAETEGLLLADQRRGTGAPADPPVVRGAQDLPRRGGRADPAVARAPAAEGIELEDGLIKVDSFAVVDVAAGRAVVELVLHEGRNHLVRRLLEAVDHPVSRLVRTAIGPVQLGHQRQGTVRKLSQREIGDLHASRHLADLDSPH